MESPFRPRRVFPARLVCVIMGAVFSCGPALAEEAADAADNVITQDFSAEGTEIGLRITPLDDSNADPGARTLSVEFTITDAATGSPIQGLEPAAWMDLQVGGTAALSCTEKVESSLSGTLAYRPMADLNAWYILTLNEKASVTVLNPLIESNTTKMLALVQLDSPGADWALTDELERLFVTLPLTDQVAVIDPGDWTLASEIAAGPRPTRAVLQPDGQYLWVGNDAAERGAGGVTIIDTRTSEVAAQLKTGDGRHDIAVSADDRIALVTNSADGWVSVVDVRQLSELKRIETGERPISIAYSDRAGAFYVADASTGEIVAIDAQSLEVRARIRAVPGLGMVRISPDGRWGFALNREESAVFVFDTATDRLVHEVSVGPEPDHIVFTDQYAYVRALGSEQLSLIGLAELGQGDTAAVIDVPGGQGLPRDGLPALASPIAPTPEENAVLIANPRDQMVYYYMEGMGAPMGSFRNYRRQARAVMAVDQGLRETAPGVYSTIARLPKHGQYDVAFLLDSPGVIHCFDVTVPPDPSVAQVAAKEPPRLDYLVDDREAAVGQDLNLRFKLTVDGDEEGEQALTGVRALAVLAPGSWHQRIDAKAVGDDVYEIPVSLPREGVYYLYVGVPSLGIDFEDLPHLILHGRKPS